MASTWVTLPAAGETVQPYAALAEAVLILHLLWCAWIIFGWTLTRRRRVLTWFHIGSLVYAIFIEVTPWPPCPLTVAENWLEMRAGLQPQTGPFLLHLLDAIVYPNVPGWAVIGGAVAVCVLILGVYVHRFMHAADPLISLIRPLSRRLQF